jgi:hypothetical protein
MKELIKRLHQLQKQGYENIQIVTILGWIAEIQRENRLKNSKTK